MLSVVIPAYNEEALLGLTLTNLNEVLAAQEIDWEIIVANDASTDRTAEIAAEHGARVVNVKKRQIAGTRNAGAKEARGDRLLFVDADTVVPSATLAAAMKALDDGAVGGGAHVEFNAKVGIIASVLLWFTTTVLFFMKYAAGCFIFVRRDAFERVGGFNEEFYASEEIWLSRQLKQEGRFVILKEEVITSDRKVRFNGRFELLWKAIVLAVKGPKAWKKREGLDLWYDGQRDQPATADPSAKA